MTLIQVMQRDPAVTAPDATLPSAAEKMASAGTSVLPVVAKRQLVGTLSAADLVARAIVGGLDSDRRTVRDVMRPDPPTCRAEDGVAQVREQMRSLRATVLPVVQPNGELVGVVNLFDLEAAEDDGMVAGPEPDSVKRVRGEPR